MKQQLITMLEMQDAMNTKVHPQWREQGNEWYRAIWIESAELMDHYGWKWWKKQEIDREQVVLELIDIWHFGISILLTSGRPLGEIASEMEFELQSQLREGEFEETDFRSDVEQFALDTLRTRGFNVASFARLMAGVGLTFDALYASYIGKNVLNFFRQDHGYKDGSYIKLWAGKEDNQHLVEVLESLDPRREDLREAVYAGLSARYQLTAN